MPDGYLVQGDWQMESGYDLSAVMALPVPPTAVFALTITCLGAREALSEMGVRYLMKPLMGFDDLRSPALGCSPNHG